MLSSMRRSTDTLASLLADAIVLAQQNGQSQLVEQLRSARAGLELVPRMLLLSSLSVRVLAGAVYRNGLPMVFPERELALLCALALREQPVSGATLCDQLYPHLDHKAASGLVKVYIHRLRTRLGDKAAIVSSADGYVLNSAIEVDVREITRYVTKTLGDQRLPELAERARLLEASALLRAERPEEMLAWGWFAPIHERYVELGREIAILLAKKSFADGQLREALQLARAIVDEDPCDELARELLIRILAGEGDRTAARRELLRFQAVLAGELQARASPALESLAPPSE